MNFRVFHNHVRDPKSGKFRPITYVNASRRQEEGMLVITHDGDKPGERKITRIPLMHVAMVDEVLQ